MIVVLFQILGLISSVHAILQTHTPQGAIAWLVSLNALPIVAVPAHWYSDAANSTAMSVHTRIPPQRYRMTFYTRQNCLTTTCKSSHCGSVSRREDLPLWLRYCN